MTAKRGVIRSLLFLALLSCFWLAATPVFGLAQGQAPEQKSDQASPEKSADSPSSATQTPAAPEHPGIGAALAKETREAEGEDEEENAKLKHSSMVQKLAKLTGLSVHQAHLVALGLNFAIIVFLVLWLARKSVPAMLRRRSDTIQRALEEARSASQEANRRLADIETRLRQLDVEIGRMQAAAEKDAEGEEVRIQKAAEEELKKVVQSAEQEIAAAAKQARRELSSHTADLAIALARKQINVDSNTDQVLVRNFASKLASKSPSGGDGGKDGR